MAREQIREVSVVEFIRAVLINDIGRMVNDCKLYYLSFGVMAQGIEFLGACLDELPFDKKGQSEKRFNKAIGDEDLFPKAYAQYNSPDAEFYLYKDLRCGLVHSVKPQNKVVLTHKEESLREGTAHLAMYRGKLVLVAEDLYDDFKQACESVISRIQEGEIACQKVREAYITVTRVSR